MAAAAALPGGGPVLPAGVSHWPGFVAPKGQEKLLRQLQQALADGVAGTLAGRTFHAPKLDGKVSVLRSPYSPLGNLRLASSRQFLLIRSSIAPFVRLSTAWCQ